MNQNDQLSQRLEIGMCLFLFLHLLLWTAVPFLVRHNLPLDAIEGTLWGHQLEWGYDKNPFMNAWLTRLAVELGGQSGWLIYGFSQLSVVTCMWVVWQLGKKVLSPSTAFIAVLALEGMQYFNFHAIDFNDNTLELGLWALTIYFFHQAIFEKQIANWVLTGLFAGLSMMTKYYTLVLLAALFLYLLSDKPSREKLKTSAPYLGLGTFLLVCLPHIIWLFQHDFTTVKYVFARADNQPHWSNHFFYPMQFAWQQFEVFIPTLVLGLFLLIGQKPLRSSDNLPCRHGSRGQAAGRQDITDAGRQDIKEPGREALFLYFIALGPIGITLALSLILGITLRAGWGMPLLSFWSILLLHWLQPRISKIKVINFSIGIAILSVGFLSAYTFSLVWSTDESSANFPGKQLAQTIEKEWHDRYGTKLKYLAGSRWIGGNIAHYGRDKPAVFIEWKKDVAPWVKTAELKKHGAVFVWDLDDHEILPDSIRKQYPTLSKARIMKYDWDRNIYDIPKGKIGIAFLPPEKT